MPIRGVRGMSGMSGWQVWEGAGAQARDWQGLPGELSYERILARVVWAQSLEATYGVGWD